MDDIDVTGFPLKLIHDLKIPHRIERSGKCSREKIDPDRYLIVIDKNHIKLRLKEILESLYINLKMPDQLYQIIINNIKHSSFLGVAYSLRAQSACKIYLEFSAGAYNKNFSDNSHIVSTSERLLFQGFKWTADYPDIFTTTDYNWSPLISYENMLTNILKILKADKHDGYFKIINEFIELISDRTHSKNILYLNVTEENSQRMSFDLNVYRSNLTMKEAQPYILRLGELLGADNDSLLFLLQKNSQKPFGHLTGGINRHGMRYFAVYWGLSKLLQGIMPS